MIPELMCMALGMWQASKERCMALQSTVSRSQSQASSLKATIQVLFQVRSFNASQPKI